MNVRSSLWLGRRAPSLMPTAAATPMVAPALLVTITLCLGLANLMVAGSRVFRGSREFKALQDVQRDFKSEASPQSTLPFHGPPRWRSTNQPRRPVYCFVLQSACGSLCIGTPLSISASNLLRAILRSKVISTIPIALLGLFHGITDDKTLLKNSSNTTVTSCAFKSTP